MRKSRESMEGKLNKIQTKERLEAARSGIKELIESEKEAQKRGELIGGSSPLLQVKPEDLTEEDLEIYTKFKEGAWTEAEFRAYTDLVTEALKVKPDNGRDNFRDWLAKKAILQFKKEEVIEAQDMDNH